MKFRIPQSVLCIMVLSLACNQLNQEEKNGHGESKLSENDSTLITNIGLNIIYHFDETGDYDQTKLLIDSAKHILADIGFDRSTTMSAILNLEAVYWQRKYDNRDTAIALLTSALEMASEEVGPESPELGDMLTNLSVMHMEMMEFEKAEQLGLRALSGFRSDTTRYTNELVATLTNLAVNYMYWEKYEGSLTKLYEAYELSVNAFGKSHSRTAEVVTHLSKLSHEMGHLERAVEYRLEALDIYLGMDPSPVDRVRTCYNNLGLLYSDMGHPNKALEQYKKAEPLYKGSGPRIATIWDNMAFEYRVIGYLDKAIEYHEKAQALEIEYYGDDDRKVSKGRSLLALAYNQAGRHSDALNQLLLSLRTDLTLYGMYSESVENAHRNLSTTYRDLGEIKRAYHHLDTAAMIQDSIMMTTRVSSLAEMSEKFESEKKENEIVVLSARAKQMAAENQRNVIIGISGLMLLLIGGVFFFNNRKQKHRVEITRAELEKKLVENDFLRSQLDPHFIKNALINIDRLLAEGKTEEAQRYNDRFYKLMNLTLENAREQLIGLDEELEMMEQYLALEADRLGNRLKWSVSVSDEINLQEIELPPMILQPLVENALKHGADMKSGKGEVKLEVRIENDRILCIVQDNGNGVDLDRMKRSASHGLRITRERLEMFSKLNLAEAKLDLVNAEVGTQAVVSFKA